MGNRLLSSLAVAVLVLVAADIVWSRLFWHRELKMTRQEIKDELKQADGDPIVKARQRSLARDRMRKRMIAAVPKATMVIANPTHYAVALRYVREEGGAPLVVAKGQDLIALKIREIAVQHGIPIVENKALARSLYRSAEVDKMIPRRVLQGGRRDRVLPLCTSGSDKAAGINSQGHAEVRQQHDTGAREGAGRRVARCRLRSAPDRCGRPDRLHPHRAVRQHRQPRELLDRALLQARHH